MSDSDSRSDSSGSTDDHTQPQAAERAGALPKGAATGGERPQFSGALKPLAIIDDLISRFEAVMLAIGVLLMALVSVTNVIGRFVFGQSLFFAEELNQFLIVLITFVGIGYAARKGRHIRMSAIYDSLPDIWRKILMIAIALVTSAAMFVLAYYSYVYVLSVAGTGRVAPSLRVPVYLTFVWVPIGFVITGIQYLLTAAVNLLRKDVFLSVSVVDSFDETETEL